MNLTTRPTEKKRILGCKYCVTSPSCDKPALKENGYISYQCEDCDNIYISPLPDLADVENLYGHDSANISAQRHLMPSRFKELHAREVLKALQKFKRSGKLLEIGIGGGTFLRAAHDAGFEVCGSDYNPIQISEVSRRYGFRCERGDYKTAFAGEKFDVIVHVDVLSHFRDPIAEFEAMSAMLNPDGVMLFQTGNFGDLSPSRRWLVDKWQYPDHLYFFSEKGLGQLMEQAGLEPLFIARYSRSVEFRFHKFLQLLMSFRHKKPIPTEKAASNGIASLKAPKTRNPVIRFATDCKGRLDHALQFQLGRVLPKFGRPQTLTVVCKKVR